MTDDRLCTCGHAAHRHFTGRCDGYGCRCTAWTVTPVVDLGPYAVGLTRMNEQLGTPPDLAALTQAVIDAADRFFGANGYMHDGDSAFDALLAAVTDRRAALAPPPPERKTWTVETEYRRVHTGECYVTTNGKMISHPADSAEQRVYGERDVIVSVEPTP